MSACNTYPLELHFHPVKSTLARLANRGFSQPFAQACWMLDAGCVTERERERFMNHQSASSPFFFFSLKSQSFGDSDKELRNYAPVCLNPALKKQQKDEEDLITECESPDQNDAGNQRCIRVCMEAGSTYTRHNRLWKGLSETSVCNEGIRLGRKRGRSLKQTFRLHNHPRGRLVFI